MRHSLSVSIVLVLTIGLALCISPSFSSRVYMSVKDPQFWTDAIENVNMTLIEGHVKHLSNLSRFTGYPGCEEAADYIQDRFVEYGLTDVFLQRYPITVPVDHGANVSILDGGVETETFDAYPLLPNGIQVCNTPPRGLEGRLVYIGDGSWTELDDKILDRSIVLMNFNTDERWLRLATFGVKAILFIEPDSTTNIETTFKYLRIAPLNIPRLLVSRDATSILMKRLQTGDVHVRVKSYMTWDKVMAPNVVGFVEGTDPGLSKSYVVIWAHFDARSVVPSIALGANEATGVATLLETARYFGKHPQKRSLLFVALSGHAQRIMGARQFVHYILYNRTDIGKDLSYLSFGFDFSTDNDQIAVTYSGWIYNKQFYYTEIRKILEIYDSSLKRYYEGVKGAWQEIYGRTWWADVATGLRFRHWDQIRPTQYGIDGEVLTLMERSTLGYITAGSFYPLEGTVHDTFEKVNLENLRPQAELALSTMIAFMDNEDLIEQDRIALDRPYGVKAESLKVLRQWQGTIVGKAVEFNPETGWYTPLPNALVQVFSDDYELDYEPFDFITADEEGVFMVTGLDPFEGGAVRVLPFVINYTKSEIVYAPDEGMYGSSAFPNIIRFPARGTASAGLYGNFTNPAFFVSFRAASLTLAGVLMPSIRARESPYVAGGVGERWSMLHFPSIVYSETRVMVSMLDVATFSRLIYQGHVGEKDVVTLFARDGEHAAIMMSGVLAEQRFLMLTGGLVAGGAGGGAEIGRPLGILINATSDNLAGYGVSFKYGEAPVLSAPLLFSKDLSLIDDDRIQLLLGRQVYVPGYNIHLESLSMHEDMLQALRERKYSDFYLKAVQTIGLGLRAYGQIRSTLFETLTSTTFIFFLLLPFAYLFERLVFDYQNVRKRLAVLTITVAALMILLFYLHPAFHIASSIFLVFFGITIAVLIAPIFLALISHVSDALSQIRERILGKHIFKTGIFSSMLPSISTGLENMRRRGFRTALTLATLTLLLTSQVFATSISSFLTTKTFVFNDVACYAGMFFRDPEFRAISEDYVEALETKYGDAAIVMPSYWWWATRPELGLTILKSNLEPWNIMGIVGVDSRLNLIFPQFDTPQLKEGRWFISEEEKSIIISEVLADQLNVGVDQRLKVLGEDLTIIGIIPQPTFEVLSHLDPNSGVTLLDLRVRDMLVFFAPSEVIFVPNRFLEERGSNIYTVLVKPTEPMDLEEEALRIASSTNLDVFYAEEEGDSVPIGRYSQAAGLDVSGYTSLLPLLAIAILIMLNVMLGNVYERTREIRVYSTVGVSPSNIAFMILAENTNFAIISSVLGYTAGILIIKLGLGTGMLPAELTPNFSANVIPMVLGLGILTVLLSSIYPMYISARLVTPSLERRWKITTKPIGDTWEVPVPFFFTARDEALALVDFMREYFAAHPSEDVAAPFAVKNVRVLENAETGTLSVSGSFHIPPFVSGLYHDAEVAISMEEERWASKVTLERTRGAMNVWKRHSRKFLDDLRKQFLFFRALTPSEKEGYTARATRLLVAGEVIDE